MKVVTIHYNDYIQQGGYFVAVFDKELTRAQARSLLINQKFVYLNQLPEYIEECVDHLLAGGGQKGNEYRWLEVTDVAIGEEI